MGFFLLKQSCLRFHVLCWFFVVVVVVFPDTDTTCTVHGCRGLILCFSQPPSSLCFLSSESPGGLEVDANVPHTLEFGLISQRSLSEVMAQNRNWCVSSDLRKHRAAVDVVQVKRVLPSFVLFFFFLIGT